MAVAPINEVRKAINYAVSVIPKKKIMMGIPLYGYKCEIREPIEVPLIM